MRTRSEIALYLLNHKRAHLRALEERFRITIMVNADATIGGQLPFVIEKGEQVHSVEQAKALALQPATAVPIEAEDEEEQEYEEEEEETSESEDTAAGVTEAVAQPEGEQGHDQGQGRKRRRRRRGRRGGEGREAFQPERDGAFPHEPVSEFAAATVEHDLGGADEAHAAGNGGAAADLPAESNGDAERRRRRRGRRGGRRNRRGREGEGFAAEPAVEPELARAVSDFDSEPAPASDPAEPLTEPQTAVPPQAEAEPPPAQATQFDAGAAEPPVSEPPRRRSTVREPAPRLAAGRRAPASTLLHPAGVDGRTGADQPGREREQRSSAPFGLVEQARLGKG